MCSLLLLGILITSKLHPGELVQKRNPGQPNLYLKIPHRPTEQDSDEFHRQLRATQGKCFQIALHCWMQKACLAAFPIPRLCPPFLPVPLHPHTCICSLHSSRWLTKRYNERAPLSTVKWWQECILTDHLLPWARSQCIPEKNSKGKALSLALSYS